MDKDWNQVWEKIDFDSHGCKKIILDSQRNIYICTIKDLTGSAQFAHYFRKYNTNGDVIWTRVWDKHGVVG